jgi:peptidoglycan/LPS O-acetylase OafA/YrhL
VLGVAAVVVLGATALAATSWYLVECPAKRLAQRRRGLAAPPARPAYESR